MSTMTVSPAERLNTLGIAHFENGRSADALMAFDRAVGADPEFAKAWNNRGLVHRQEGRLREALTDFQRAVDLDPAEPKLRANLAQVKRQLGDLVGAEVDFTSAIEQSTSDVDKRYWHMDRGGVRRDLGKLADARTDYSAAISLDPVDSEGYELRGRLALDTRDFPAAYQDFTKAIALCPPEELAKLLHLRAAVAVGRKRFADAVTDYNRAIAADPRYALAYISRGHAYYHLRIYRRAILDYRRGAGLDVKLTVRELVRITRQHAIENPDGTLANCHKHLETQPDDILARLRLAVTLWLVGRREEMVEHLLRVKALDPLFAAECEPFLRALFAEGDLTTALSS